MHPFPIPQKYQKTLCFHEVEKERIVKEWVKDKSFKIFSKPFLPIFSFYTPW